MRVLGIGSALPGNYYPQEAILARLQEEWSQKHHNPDRLRRLHENVLVGGRHLALPIERYDELDDFGKSNDAWIEVGLEVGEQSLRRALDDAGVGPQEVGALFFVSVTGLAVPSLDARLMNRVDLSSKTKRYPLFGLGCVAGAAGVARAADYVKAYPDELAVLLSVELCSLTVQRSDLSIPNLIATGLFGDGAAAVVLGGSEASASRQDDLAGPEIIATRSVFYPDSEDVMGWRIGQDGFTVVLSADVPKVVQENLGADVDRFLADHGLLRSSISSWVCHPGGPKVLEAMSSALDLEADSLDVTWRSLREVGNLSSTSVLLVLEETMRQHRPTPDSWGMLLAMGPGFCSELVLLRW